jgi:asparagine synthase (glutamine-hydrolysing)
MALLFRNKIGGDMPGIIFISDIRNDNFHKNKNTMNEMIKITLHETFYKYMTVDVENMGLLAGIVYMDHEDPNEKMYASHDGSLICLLNGEIFGKQELYSKLSTTQIRASGTDYTSKIITELYRQEGMGFLKHINGHFSLLLIDKNHKRAIFGNDRMNFHRGYLWQGQNGSIVVAPELKCILKHPEAKLTLNQDTIVEYFKYDALLGEKTFYKEISRLSNATSLVIADNKLEIHEYWSPDAVTRLGELAEKDYLEKSAQIFYSIVDDYVTPGKTGLSLTGGWDTRTILSTLHNKKISLPCYTFGGKLKDSYDVTIAKRLAQDTDNLYRKIVIGDAFTKNVDYWANKAVFVSDGISRISTSYEYFVNMEARKVGPVRLTGKYGSQIVRRASMLKDRSPDTRIFNGFFKDAMKNYSKAAKYDPINQIVREEIPYVFSSSQAQEQAALTIRTPFLDNRLVEIMLRAPVLSDTAILQKQIIDKYAPSFGNIPTNRGEFIKTNYLRKMIKAKYKTFSLFDDVYNWERLPHVALPVCKVGDLLGISNYFNGKAEYRHFRLWFLEEMKSFTKNILLDPATLKRQWYDANFIGKMARNHYAGIMNFTYEIDKIVSFELWLRQNNL